MNFDFAWGLNYRQRLFPKGFKASQESYISTCYLIKKVDICLLYGLQVLFDYVDEFFPV